MHFANDCPRLRTLRKEILKKQTIEGTDTGLIGSVLELSKVPAIDPLLYPVMSWTTMV